jgi:magnesium transporter
MIKTFYFSSENNQMLHPELGDIQSSLNNENGFLWVSIEQATDEELLSVLRDVFHFHPLAIEDCQSSGYQTPKVDDFEDYLFLIVNAIAASEDYKDLITRELNIFLGKNYLVTCYTDSSMPPVEYVLNRIRKDERLWKNGPDFLCHAIIDFLVDGYMPLLDNMDEEVENLEDDVLASPNPATLQRLIFLKHNIMSLRKVISPLREVVNRLSRDDFPQIDEQSKIYYRDIYDHLVRIQDLNESIRDIVSGAMDIYLNSTSLRLNAIMKALTIVSTIFLPLTFLAGVYGMNFHFMPELTWKLGYPILWFVFLLIVAVMLGFFKKRDWF